MKDTFKKMATILTRPGSRESSTAQEAARADVARLEGAIDAHWDAVCRTLYRLVGDWDEAEDLALETFYRFHQQPPDEADSQRGWLHRVATNLGLNALRARNRRRRYEDEAGTQIMEQAAPPNPAVEVERREAGRRVRRVLSALKPRDARLLVLRYAGLSYAELASALDVSPGSVGTLLARAERAFERRYRALEGSDATSE